jgi:hypothetical protein
MPTVHTVFGDREVTEDEAATLKAQGLAPDGRHGLACSQSSHAKPPAHAVSPAQNSTRTARTYSHPRPWSSSRPAQDAGRPPRNRMRRRYRPPHGHVR